MEEGSGGGGVGKERGVREKWVLGFLSDRDERSH